MLMTTGYDHYDYGISSEKNPVNAYSLGFNINQGVILKPISIITSTASTRLNLGLTVFITNYTRVIINRKERVAGCTGYHACRARPRIGVVP